MGLLKKKDKDRIGQDEVAAQRRRRWRWFTDFIAETAVRRKPAALHGQLPERQRHSRMADHHQLARKARSQRRRRL